jgi:hypothetical protein
MQIIALPLVLGCYLGVVSMITAIDGAFI